MFSLDITPTETIIQIWTEINLRKYDIENRSVIFPSGTEGNSRTICTTKKNP